MPNTSLEFLRVAGITSAYRSALSLIYATLNFLLSPSNTSRSPVMSLISNTGRLPSSLVFTRTQAAELQHLLQHEGISRRPRIHRQTLTFQGGVR